MSSAARAELEGKLASIREENREIIARAVDVANEISRLFEGLIQQGKLTQESLFDNDYVAVEGSDPVQHVTKFLPALEDVLPPLQEALLASDQRMVFCATVDRNGYLPVHNRNIRCHSAPARAHGT